MLQSRALYQVQELELDIIKRTKRIKSINVLLEDDEELKKQQETFTSKEERLDECQKSVKEMEHQIALVVDKRQVSETRLYGGEVTNTKEMQDMQMEIEALMRRQTQLDEQLLQLMIERDRAAADFEEKQGKLEATSAEYEALQKELLTEKRALKKSVDALMADRRAAIEQVPEQVIKIYHGMRSAKSNRPVSILKDNACMVCGIEQNHIVITAINRGEQLVRCNNCGRILVKL